MGVSGQLHVLNTVHPQVKNPWCPLGRSLGGPQSGLDGMVRRKRIPAPTENQTPVIQPVA